VGKVTLSSKGKDSCEIRMKPKKKTRASKGGIHPEIKKTCRVRGRIDAKRKGGQKRKKQPAAVHVGVR